MAAILAALADPAAQSTTTTHPSSERNSEDDDDDDDDTPDPYVAPMDRTIAPGDATELVDGMDSLYHVGTSNIKITYLGGLEQLAPTLTELSLRSNLIRRLEGIETLSKLVSIELADNAIRKMGPMNLAVTCPLLTNLDLSYNQIRRIENIRGLIHLKHLYVANNKLTTIGMEEGLGSLPINLKRLDLGYNRIRHMENIPPSLEELWLGKNKITVIKGLSHMDGSLRILDIQSNRLVSLLHGAPAKKEEDQKAANTLEKAMKAVALGEAGEGGKGGKGGREGEGEGEGEGERKNITADSEDGAATTSNSTSNLMPREDEKEGMIGLHLECLSNVEELYLSHQGIKSMVGLTHLVSLQTLDLSSNEITEFEDMHTLLKLEECWMNDNKIETFATLQSQLVPLDATLRTVYLERNPVAEEYLYRKTLGAMLPSLTQIDASRIPGRKR